MNAFKYFMTNNFTNLVNVDSINDFKFLKDAFAEGIENYAVRAQA